MAIKIKSQTDYLLTEVRIQLPCQLDDLDTLMKMMKGTGKIVSLYQEGGVLGINVEQRTRIREGVSEKVRKLIGVDNKEINGVSSDV